MKYKLLLTVFALLISVALNAQTLGNYSASTVIAGGNLTVVPSAIPTSTVRIQVTSSTNLQAILTGNPTNGKVYITNAKPAGTYTITVKAFNSFGSTVTKTFTLTITSTNCSHGNFVNNPSVATGLQQLNVAIGDFNNDGKQDLACAHEGGNNTLSIRMGNGNGGFTGTTEISVGSHPFNIAIGDFNRDGKQDIVICNSGDNCFTPLLGNGSGGFTIRPVVDVSWTPVSIAIGDFNSDGKQDVITSNLNGANVSIRFGDGIGGFYGSTDINVGVNPNCVVVGDFNNDGKHDFATANSHDNDVSIRIGNGNGTFSSSTNVPVGVNPNGITLSDFDSDGKQDFATANYLNNSMSVRLGDGAGGFSGTTEVTVGSNPYGITVGNFNGDDNPDLAVSNYFGNNVSIRFGNGTGGFIGGTEIPTGNYSISVATGDFDNDNLMDLAVSSYGDACVNIRMGVSDSAVANSIFTSSPVCEGQPIYFQAFGGISYNWTGPNGFSATGGHVFIPVSDISDSGIYHVVIVDSSNCTVVANSHIVINPIPIVTFSIDTDTVCMNDPIITFQDGTPPGGNFSGIGIINNNQFNPHTSGPGEFTITYTFVDPNDCVSSDSAKIFVMPCDVSVRENENFDAGIYPNPVTDYFMIRNQQSNKTVSLFLPDGKLVRVWNNQHSYSMEGLSEGIYFIKLVDNNQTYFSRIIKTN